MDKSLNHSIYREKDKNLTAFLLASEGISFCGTEIAEDGRAIYFLFKPRQKAAEFINLYFSGREPHIPAKTLLEAVDNFRTILFKAKNESKSSYGCNHGKVYEKSKQP